jgi:hypothetical protein
MANRVFRTVGLASIALLIAATAQAQGRKHDRNDHRSHERSGDWHDGRRRDVYVRDVRHDRDGRDNRFYGRRVPPGLAKKPGQMPPGQFKKHYRAYQGADVLGDILRRRGNRVRIVSAGEARYVYYRPNYGAERWVLVRPGTNRLYFDNAPSSLLQAVLERLY